MRIAALQSNAASHGASVTLQGIGRSFGETSVLEGVDLEIKPGEFVAIVGQSGSGKSTLLRIIAGLDQAYKGNLSIGASKGQKTAARIMYQEPRLLPWASVIENVAFGLGPQATRHQAFAQARTALDAVGLGDRGGEWPDVLSGGQKQRVALARALVSKPDLLVLDEPLARVRCTHPHRYAKPSGACLARAGLYRHFGYP